MDCLYPLELMNIIYKLKSGVRKFWKTMLEGKHWVRKIKAQIKKKIYRTVSFFYQVVHNNISLDSNRSNTNPTHSLTCLSPVVPNFPPITINIFLADTIKFTLHCLLQNRGKILVELNLKCY